MAYRSATFLLIWPERRQVSAPKMRVMYEDAVANGEVDDTTLTDVFAQARELHAAGLITLADVNASYGRR